MDSALAFTAATLPLVTITKVNRHFITHDTRSFLRHSSSQLGTLRLSSVYSRKNNALASSPSLGTVVPLLTPPFGMRFPAPRRLSGPRPAAAEVAASSEEAAEAADRMVVTRSRIRLRELWTRRRFRCFRRMLSYLMLEE
ncbi:hypothetical protein OIU78_010650 [Salix suchowensis]|nr:hypothetical protein OIU78_010650 [Salix suchowensis]